MKNKILEAKKKLIGQYDPENIYNPGYYKKLKIKEMEKLKQANAERTAKLKEANIKKMQILKDKYATKALSMEEIANYKLQINAVTIQSLEKITGEGLSAGQIYIVAKELRDRGNVEQADKFISIAEASNFLEKYKGDQEYKTILKEASAVSIISNNPDKYYSLADEESPLSMENFVNLDDSLLD